jgi:molybdenum cofactor synthesis domain-containing protein
MIKDNPTACILIIGNEILSGKTQDLNTEFLAKELSKLGIKVTEGRTVLDIEDEIIKAVHELRSKCDYVFTTGGIGPTHDDITAKTMAKAFNRDYTLNEEADKILTNFYKENNITPTTHKMAYMPEGVELIRNPDSAAPGFIIENVYVMAGIPYVMHSMFNATKHTLKKGKAILNHAVDIFITESTISRDFEALQQHYPEVEMGSYPFKRRDNWGTTLVLRSSNEREFNKAVDELGKMLNNY